MLIYMGVDQGVDRGTCPPMFGWEGDTISNVPLTNWSKFIFYLVENCHSYVLYLTIFKHFKHQNDNFARASRAFTTKLCMGLTTLDMLCRRFTMALWVQIIEEVFLIAIYR